MCKRQRQAKLLGVKKIRIEHLDENGVFMKASGMKNGHENI